MEDFLKDKTIIDNMMDYGKICERQQVQISKLTEQIGKLNEIIEDLREENKQYKQQLDSQRRANQEIQIAYMKLRADLAIQEQRQENKMRNGQKPKVDKKTFLQAYEITRNSRELSNILGVQLQSVYNYKVLYLGGNNNGQE